MCWYKGMKADNVSKREYADKAEGLLLTQAINSLVFALLISATMNSGVL